jgi:putative hemolysin
MKYIDIEKSLKESKSKAVANLPVFIVKVIAKILREEELNRILNKYKDCEGVDFHKKIVEEFNLTLEIEGIENLPVNGKCFFASNHPFGVIDGLVLTKIVGDKYGDFRAIGNDAFMFVPNLRPYIAMVNVYGRSSKENIAALQKIYDSNIPITHFPAGEVSRLYWGKVQDCKWQKSFITKAIASQRDIVPFYFYGRNSWLFHTVSLLRRMVFIKANIELMLLSREMFKKKNKTIKVRIGKPVSYQKFDNSLTHKDWAQFMRSLVYSLRKKRDVSKELE